MATKAQQAGNAARARVAANNSNSSAPNNIPLPNGQMLPNSSAIWGMWNNLWGIGANVWNWLPNSQVPFGGTGPNISDLYNNYMAAYQQTNPAVANMYQMQYNWYDDFTKASTGINQLYDGLTNSTNNLYKGFTDVNSQLDADITGKLKDTLAQAYSQYWPNGSQTKLVEDYYRNSANTLAAQNAVDIGEITAQSQAAGANAWASRNARAWANINANKQFAEMKQSEIANYDNIYKALNEYKTAFDQNYANSKNLYVRDTYNQLVNAMDNINQQRTASQQSLLQSQLEQKMADDLYEKEAKRLASIAASGGGGGWSGSAPQAQSAIQTPKGPTITPTGRNGSYNGVNSPIYQGSDGKYYMYINGKLTAVKGNTSTTQAPAVQNYVQNQVYGNNIPIATTTNPTLGTTAWQPNFIGWYINNQLNRLWTL